MNLLEQWIEDNLEDPEKIMDLLQSHGIISDNSLMPQDVADQDASAAVAFLAG